MWQRRESDDEAAVHERLTRVLGPSATASTIEQPTATELTVTEPAVSELTVTEPAVSELVTEPAATASTVRETVAPGSATGREVMSDQSMPAPAATWAGRAAVDGDGDGTSEVWPEIPPAAPVGPASTRALLAGALDPGRRGVRALAVLVAVVVAGAAALAWQARPRVEPVAGATSGVVGVAAAASPTALVVAVAGRVRRPGLVHLPAGARVADAIAAAGGALPGTDLAFVNLARRVTDGEMILVGFTPPPGAPGGPSGPGQPSGGQVNLNTATLAQLDQLPGVGPVLAQRILDYRAAHGGFRSVAELRQVDGVGDTRYEQLKSLVTV